VPALAAVVARAAGLPAPVSAHSTHAAIPSLPSPIGNASFRLSCGSGQVRVADACEPNEVGQAAGDADVLPGLEAISIEHVRQSKGQSAPVVAAQLLEMGRFIASGHLDVVNPL
jgi:hypothetical protein